MSAPAVNVPPFCTNVAGVEVLYLEGHPSLVSLKHELVVLKSFVADWNRDKAPDGKARAFLVIAAGQHKSTYTPDEPQRITISICNNAEWNSDPVKFRFTVHVFSNNEDPVQGYKEYVIAREKSNDKAKGAFVGKIQTALAKRYAELNLA